MELSNQEGEIPIPINSNYGGGHGNGHGHGHGHGHMIHHHVDPPPPHNINITSSSPAAAAALPQNPSINGSSMQAAPASVLVDHHCKKVAVQVRYRECLKNHAAAMGGNATDGCGEFMPSGEEGTIEALNCSACHCHRNFHRKEVEGDSSSEYHHASHFNRLQGRKFILGPPHKNLLPPEALGYHPTAATGNILPSRSVPPHHMIMPYNYSIGPLPSESDEQEENAAAAAAGGGGGMVMARPTQLVKKRFRTKFSQEQKEKMLGFAEKVGWKIQKQEESVVQEFCQEIGVKRRVLKVWMHNNKHNLAKKNLPPA